MPHLRTDGNGEEATFHIGSLPHLHSHSSINPSFQAASRCCFRRASTASPSSWACRSDCPPPSWASTAGCSTFARRPSARRTGSPTRTSRKVGRNTPGHSILYIPNVYRLGSISLADSKIPSLVLQVFIIMNPIDLNLEPPILAVSGRRCKTKYKS